MVNKIIDLHKTVIVLNGILPGKKIIQKLIKKRTVIAADGALSKLLNIDIVPDYVIGDMDSCKVKNKESIEYIRIDNQDYTDFDKSILYAKEHNLSPAIVLGINGGEIDHTINNLYSLMKYYKISGAIFVDQYSDGKISNDKIKIGIPCDNKIELKLPQKSIISIIPFPQANISSQGLRWELNNTLLENLATSARNFSIGENIELTVHNGNVLLIIDYFSNQLG